MTGLLHLFKNNSLTKRLEKIKNGDEQEREKLIEAYIPFIIKTVSNKTNKYIESENSEEFSIGMEAFNEAIDKYDVSKGNFIPFAELVISSRIIDYLRKMKKHTENILISQLEEEEGSSIEDHFKIEDFTNSLELKDEIRGLEKRLKEFDITFSDLVKEAPKHRDTREKGIVIAQSIIKDEYLLEEMMKKKCLPTSKLIEKLNITLKILKRSRKFIIATVLILDSDLDLLKDYISKTQGGAVNGL